MRWRAMGRSWWLWARGWPIVVIKLLFLFYVPPTGATILSFSGRVWNQTERTGGFRGQYTDPRLHPILRVCERVLPRSWAEDLVFLAVWHLHRTVFEIRPAARKGKPEQNSPPRTCPLSSHGTTPASGGKDVAGRLWRGSPDGAPGYSDSSSRRRTKMPGFGS